MEWSESLQWHFRSLDPSTIVLGAKATRNPNNCVKIYNCPTPDSTQLIRLHQDNKRLDTVKQPHHKLPLKMILSEVARRGEDNDNSATVPGAEHESRSLSPIDDIFINPPENNGNNSRLESLTHPRYLGKKHNRKMLNYTDRLIMTDVEKMQKHCSNYYKNHTNMCTTRINSYLSFEEDPLISNYDNLQSKPCEEMMSCITPQSQLLCSSSYGSLTPDNLSLGKLQYNRQDSKSYVQESNYSTPFSKLRFQHLYGNEVSKLSQQTQPNETTTKTDNTLNYVQMNLRRDNGISENTVIDPISIPLSDSSINKKVDLPVSSQSPSFSSSESFLRTVDQYGKRKRVCRDDFIWQPKYHKVGAEVLRKDSRNHLGSIDEDDEGNQIHMSNYSYAVTEYSLTIDSQEDEILV